MVNKKKWRDSRKDEEGKWIDAEMKKERRKPCTTPTPSLHFLIFRSFDSFLCTGRRN
jgi:hypothetical protein